LSVSVGAARTKVVASSLRVSAPALFADRTRRRRNCPDPLPMEKLYGIATWQFGALGRTRACHHRQLAPGAKPRCKRPFGEVIGCKSGSAPAARWREVLLRLSPKSVSRETTIEGGTASTRNFSRLIEYLSERIGSTLRE